MARGLLPTLAVGFLFSGVGSSYVLGGETSSIDWRNLNPGRASAYSVAPDAAVRRVQAPPELRRVPTPDQPPPNSDDPVDLLDLTAQPPQLPENLTAEEPPSVAQPIVVQPPAPPATVPSSTPAPAFSAPTTPSLFGSATGLADLAGSFDVPPNMIGDQGPFARRIVVRAPRTLLPAAVPDNGIPPEPPDPNPGRRAQTVVIPWVKGFKLAENQSPRPQDRLFFGFNYYEDVNGSINKRLGAPVENIRIFREIFGFEKTFLQQRASIGMRLPLNSMSADSNIRGLGGWDNALGNLMIFSKFILSENTENGNLLSAGFAVSPNTGPKQFAGSPVAFPVNNTQLQPFIGYIWNRGRLYLQGFEAIDVPMNPNDVTMLYNDVALGYYLYQNPDRNAWLSAVVPTFEVHVNVPLNHRGAFRFNDPLGTPDVVDLTFGTNFQIKQRSFVTVALVTPVTGPRPFDYELTVLFNYYFGRGATPRGGPMPPVTGG